MRLFVAAIALALCSPSLSIQAQANEPAGVSPLHDYETCSFDDGLQIVKIDSLPPGVQVRSVDTKSGPKPIRMLDGRRIMFAYGLGGDYFANVKPELLPSDTWAVEKQSLLDEIDALLSSDHQSMPNKELPAELQGLEVHGFDRIALQGDVLGFYLLFDDARHVATSVYMLNQEPLTRKFQTIEQYRQLRTRFLSTYTGCIAQNQSMHRATIKDAPKDKPKDAQ